MSISGLSQSSANVANRARKFAAMGLDVQLLAEVERLLHIRNLGEVWQLAPNVLKLASKPGLLRNTTMVI